MAACYKHLCMQDLDSWHGPSFCNNPQLNSLLKVGKVPILIASLHYLIGGMKTSNCNNSH